MGLNSGGGVVEASGNPCRHRTGFGGRFHCRTARTGRTRRDAAAQRLADRAGRPARHGRRPAAGDGRVARRPLARRHQQRLREADADGRGPATRCTVPDQTSDGTDAWLGLAWHPDGQRLFASGGADGTVREFSGTRASSRPRADLRRRHSRQRRDFSGGLAVSPDGGASTSCDVLGQRLSARRPGDRRTS